MTLPDINMELEKIEKSIFRNSLYRDLSLTDIAGLYRELIQLKNQFLSSSFLEMMPMEELEDLRFHLLECIVNVKIEIKEKVGLDYKKDIEELKELLTQ